MNWITNIHTHIPERRNTAAAEYILLLLHRVVVQIQTTNSSSIDERCHSCSLRSQVLILAWWVDLRVYVLCMSIYGRVDTSTTTAAATACQATIQNKIHLFFVLFFILFSYIEDVFFVLFCIFVFGDLEIWRFPRAAGGA